MVLVCHLRDMQAWNNTTCLKQPQDHQTNLLWELVISD